EKEKEEEGREEEEIREKGEKEEESEMESEKKEEEEFEVFDGDRELDEKRERVGGEVFEIEHGKMAEKQSLRVIEPVVSNKVKIGSLREDDERVKVWLEEIGSPMASCNFHPRRWYYVEEKSVCFIIIFFFNF